jgi:hypothetical protein
MEFHLHDFSISNGLYPRHSAKIILIKLTSKIRSVKTGELSGKEKRSWRAPAIREKNCRRTKNRIVNARSDFNPDHWNDYGRRTEGRFHFSVGNGYYRAIVIVRNCSTVQPGV